MKIARWAALGLVLAALINGAFVARQIAAAVPPGGWHLGGGSIP